MVANNFKSAHRFYRGSPYTKANTHYKTYNTSSDTSTHRQHCDVHMKYNRYIIAEVCFCNMDSDMHTVTPKNTIPYSLL